MWFSSGQWISAVRSRTSSAFLIKETDTRELNGMAFSSFFSVLNAGVIPYALAALLQPWGNKNNDKRIQVNGEAESWKEPGSLITLLNSEGAYFIMV